MELNIAWKISKTGSSHCGSVGWIPNTVSVRMWVRSLASLSELRIWHCHKVQCRSQAQLGSEAPIQPSNLGNFHMLQAVVHPTLRRQVLLVGLKTSEIARRAVRNLNSTCTKHAHTCLLLKQARGSRLRLPRILASFTRLHWFALGTTLSSCSSFPCSRSLLMPLREQCWPLDIGEALTHIWHWF